MESKGELRYRVSLLEDKVSDLWESTRRLQRQREDLASHLVDVLDVREAYEYGGEWDEFTRSYHAVRLNVELLIHDLEAVKETRDAEARLTPNTKGEKSD